MILKQKLDSQKARPAEVTASSISLSSCISITTTTTNIAKNSNPPKKNTDLAYFPHSIPIPISKSPKLLQELCLLHYHFIPYKKHRSVLVEITKEDYQL